MKLNNFLNHYHCNEITCVRISTPNMVASKVMRITEIPRKYLLSKIEFFSLDAIGNNNLDMYEKSLCLFISLKDDCD